ncbi:cysteine three histidine 1 [Chanos chanos]|uniref:mRNA decay activator protein ZFP36 n=1 Tax=Chanos chanos TaxID=29144 RepID=A0A6J2VSD9_CHACN|nr:mRNA decay activator protein ZFP36L2-like [Chanos chanos]
MLETSYEDLILFPSDEAVDDLFSGDVPGSVGLSLAEALLPLVESSSPLPTPWLCSTRYKTELCSRYAETGTCKYAERCQFAHGLHDLHVPSRHPKYKTELCRTFHTVGYCVYGTRCLFVHSLKEQRPTQQRRRDIPCRTFLSFGVCPFGSRCHFLHMGSCGLDSDSAGEKSWPPPRSQEWKPRGALCRTFSSFGFCLYGTRCRFQHRLPSTVRGPDHSPGSTPSPEGPGKVLYPVSDVCSSLFSSSPASPPSALASPVCPDEGLLTPPSSEPMANNAFTFSSQHLNSLLTPLTLKLQMLEKTGHSPFKDVVDESLILSMFKK